jgi:hypothetical protein
MMDYDTIVAQVLALLQQQTGAPCDGRHYESAMRRHLPRSPIAVFTRMYGTGEGEAPAREGKPRWIPYI